MNVREKRLKRTRVKRANRTRRRRVGGALRRNADQRLRFFRRSTLIAVAFTGLLLLILTPADVGIGQEPGSIGATDTIAQLPDSVAIIRQVPTDAIRRAAADSAEHLGPNARQSVAEATGALRTLWSTFVGNLPKYGIAVGILFAAWLFIRILRAVLRRGLARWERADAITTLTGVVIWLLAAGIALSVVLGDIRALAGSLGLVGLALSWALQTPIESFTGWLLNSFKGYYRVGDRIAVGDVFGDVYQIDFLNTTVWEYGGPDRPPGSIMAEQPTGRLITFPNNEIVTGSIVNYTRDFPYVWDEYAVAVANESDLTYAIGVLEEIATSLLGEYMREPARMYHSLLATEGLETSVADRPEVYVSTTDWSTDLTIRYLVGAREKRGWKSKLVVCVAEELSRSEHAGRIIPVYPRQQIQLVQPDGTAAPGPVAAEAVSKPTEGQDPPV